MEGAPVLEVVDAPLEAEDAILAGAPLPEALPVLPLRDTVAFPETLAPLAVGQERSIQLIDDVLGTNRMLVMVASRDPEKEEPGPDDLYDVGVAGAVARMVKIPDGTLRILVQGMQRVKLGEFVAERPYMVARVDELPDVIEPSAELEALSRNVQRTFSEIVEQIPYLPEELQLAVANIDDPSTLAHLIAGALRIGTEEKQKLLEEIDVAKRLRHLSRLLTRELEVVQLGTQIQSQVESEIDKGQREFFLRQQLKAIQEELGEGDEQQAEAGELREKIEAAELPEHALKAAERELARLEKLPPAAAEHGVIRTYLEWMVELPWSQETEDDLDLKHARKVLDADHYDLEKIKDRILEYLAVRKLNPESPGPILCFVGPPGVGKTSLGRSIAKALGREFERISVGGVRDEAEIRGHRRTYIGAMPGTIVRALRDAGSRNPVFMIDEIDKMGADYRGDPASAMLEVLDPEQNSSFRDHYLDVPFDLSRVMFLATANVLPQIPEPLRDRMEILEIPGYLLEEKVEIGRRHLLPKQLERHGLLPRHLSIAPVVWKDIVAQHTREAGVRGLDKVVQRLCRKAALDVAKGGTGPGKLSRAEMEQMLGRAKFKPDERRKQRIAGVVQGLAWTPVGGDVLYVEVTGAPGKGALQITGSLGDVMAESARLALSYLKSRASAFGLDLPRLAETDLHLHFPAGAIPKDGPSAGITIACALLSYLIGRPAPVDLAMTGELTVVGEVLPIGGVREKVLAAKNFGLARVLLPKGNEPEIAELKPDLVQGVQFHYASRFDDVFAVVFGNAQRAAARGKAPVRATRNTAARHG